MDTRKDYFDVCVKVLEGSSVTGAEISSLVCVQVGKDRKFTRVVPNSSKPFYDAYFVFTNYTTFPEFMNTIITISIFEKRGFIKMKKPIGCVSLDVATVWSYPDRRFRKWFAVTLPTDKSSQKNGFVECELKVEANEYYPLMPKIKGSEWTDMVGGKRARYKVLIFHCTGLEVLKAKNVPDVLIRVIYAGRAGKTSRRKLKEFVEWNEQVVFVELFPPLYQKLTLELCIGKNVMALKYFNLCDFFKIFEGGFLKLFGPTYVHLYAKEYVYHGSLLMCIQSELAGILREFERFQGVTLQQIINPISEVVYGKKDKFLCFGVLFDLIITKKDYTNENICLCLEIGRAGNAKTDKLKAVRSGSVIYVPFNERKPGISLIFEWPDTTYRILKSNMLSNLADEIRDKVELASGLIAKGSVEEAKYLLIPLIRRFQRGCKLVLRLLSKGVTELDKTRTQYISYHLNEFVSTTFDVNDAVSILEKFKLLLYVIDVYCEDPQDSVPSLVISLEQDGKVIGSCKVQPRHIFFSHSKQKRGSSSAKINYISLKSEDGEVVARTDFWLWLGHWDKLPYCIAHIPPGYSNFSEYGSTVVDENKTVKSANPTFKNLPRDVSPPTEIIYETKIMYTVLCLIYSGCIDDELVNEGLCDSYVKVHISNQNQETITARRSLAPTWKETIIFSDVQLYPSPYYLKEHPPSLTIQLWNRSEKPVTLLGTGLVTSRVTLQPIKNVPEFSLKWVKLGGKCEVLAAFEIIEKPADDGGEKFNMRKQPIIPRLIEPLTKDYRLEVIFWGLRPLNKSGLKNIIQPQVTIQCGTTEISSNVIARTSDTFNFQRDTQMIKLQLPENRLYSPALIIRIVANATYIGSIIEKNIFRYECHLPRRHVWGALNAHRMGKKTSASHRVTMPDIIPQRDVSDDDRVSFVDSLRKNFNNAFRDRLFSKLLFKESTVNEGGNDETLEHDWWERYMNGDLNIYPSELEKQEHFNGFNDVLSTFTVNQKKGNNSNDVAKLKLILGLYQWPLKHRVVTTQGQDPEMGVLKLSGFNERVNLLVRVYCVRARNLHPTDIGSGRADPYIEIATPSKVVSNQSQKIFNQLNPVFGCCLELQATLPTDSLLVVRVMDWDLLTSNDLIGETIIDIENRYYSKYRATCGLPTSFNRVGNNAWRDIELPSEILERLCNTHNLPLPEYLESCVVIGSKQFFLPKLTMDRIDNQERLALAALNSWEEMPIVGRKLVGEHVETRSLYREDIHGLEQGKLEMWVDLFDLSLGTAPPPIDIAPITPQVYELRVTIYRTANVPLVDESAITGKQCADIFVAGWLGKAENIQKTDVHFNNYTGEGEFNWRFVFKLLYYQQEQKLVYYRKNLFDIGKTEYKMEPNLHLEVYDSDGLLGDLMIGGIVLNLNHMPRGAISPSECEKLTALLDSTNQVDLFVEEQLFGWWPFLQEKNIMKQRGCVEAEFHLVSGQEAVKIPVGIGRSGPNALPLPERLAGKQNPWAKFLNLASKLTIFKKFFVYLLNFVIVLIIIGLIGVLVYTIPGLLQRTKPWEL